MSYTLAVAAAACGLNKTTVLRAIKTGKVSGTKDEKGEWHVEPIDLHRVYPAVAERDAGNRCDAAIRTPKAAALAAVQRRAELAEEKLCMLMGLIDDMRSDRDAWKNQAQRLALPSPQPSVTWWRWLRSTG